MDLESLAAAQAASVGGALDAAQALIGAGGAGELWIVTRGAQPAGGTVAAPEQAPLWGLGRVIAVEHPDLWGGLIDLAPDADAAGAAAAIAAEIGQGDGEDQVALRGDERLVARLVRSAARTGGAVTWRPDGSYLITGGLGGLGLRMARWMAEAGARSIVLVGRRGLPGRDAWDALGARQPGGRPGGRRSAPSRPSAPTSWSWPPTSPIRWRWVR